MANGVDPRIRLANAVAEENEDTEGSIQAMFDVLRHKDVEEDMAYVPMLTFYELVGHDAQTIEDYAQFITIPLPGGRSIQTDELFDLVFGESTQDELESQIIDLDESAYREVPEEKTYEIPAQLLEKKPEIISIEESLLEVLELLPDIKSSYKKETKKDAKKKGKGLIDGQINILDLFSA